MFSIAFPIKKRGLFPIFLAMSIKVLLVYGVSILERETNPLYELDHLRGHRFREFGITFFIGLSGVGNGWWHYHAKSRQGLENITTI